mgnify:FL=1
MGNNSEESLIFEPEKWHSCDDHDGMKCAEGVNCYSYALNNPKLYWSQPGFGFIKKIARDYIDDFNKYFASLSVEQFRKAMIDGAIRDGLSAIDSPASNLTHYSVALYFADRGTDFDLHWYRLDDNGTWSHKNGWSKVSDLDDAGQIIIKLDVPPNIEYPVFGSYFLVPRTGINITNTFPSRVINEQK